MDEVTRRDFLALAAVAAGASLISKRGIGAEMKPENLTDFQAMGNVTLLHMTDSHATLLPMHYREPDSLYGVGGEAGKPPYLTGKALLDHYGFKPGSLEAHAYTHLSFAELAQQYGPMGGYAHIAALVNRVKTERPGKVLLLDGGDTIQGSATALWTQGRDMIDVVNQLGVEVFSPHWEFTYGIDKVREYFGDAEKQGVFKGDFVAQNVRDTQWREPVFKPYTVRETGGVKIGVIGQAFPYTPISHPLRFVPDLTFGIEEGRIQELVDTLRNKEKADVVVLLSHNGFSVDWKLAGRVKGIDVILGGHTHDALAQPVKVGNTLVIQSGAHGKWLSRLDLDVKDKRVRGWRYKLIPVLSKSLPSDPAMAKLIEDIRAPFKDKLSEKLAVSESLLWRRGNFNGPFDEIILDALMKHYDAQIAFSPGFRWGVSILPGQSITQEDVFTHTGLTYPNTWSRELMGAEIKHIMEDVANNLFHPDPYARQGGDMVRVGGASYAIDPRKPMGQRISNIMVAGKPLDQAKSYKTAGWASMQEMKGPPCYDVVTAYLRGQGKVKIEDRNRVQLIG
ncbi:Sulfate thiol esterase SoxB [Rhodospirillaceae bacterium LM-1]|nr:Sulfate thiol esterase SoxB [Rhodospirillaceae bacterium LM-1]